uniref:Uncharacterized protein n=1 Tax=Plectus sambesii TaxID=2011161 RepID=A0A914XGV9_9BILA
MLKDTWYFDCQCTRCVDNQEHILTSIKCPSCSEILSIFGEQPYKDPVTQVIICPKCLTTCSKESVFEAVNAMRFIDEVLEKDELSSMNNETARIFLQELLERFTPFLSHTNVYLCRILQALIPRIDPEEHETLLQYHLNALDCMKVCYPHNHPALAFHLMNIGIFYTRLKRDEDARNYLTQSQNMLDFALGKDHPMSCANRAELEKVQGV